MKPPFYKRGKVILFLVILLTFPQIVNGYVSYHWHKILFVSSETPIKVTTESIGEGINQAIVIEDEHGVYLYGIKGAKVCSDCTNTYNKSSLLPEHDGQIETGGYKFWKIEGIDADYHFYIIGVTFEGDLIENHIIPHALIILGMIVFLCFLIVKKKRLFHS